MKVEVYWDTTYNPDDYFAPKAEDFKIGATYYRIDWYNTRPMISLPHLKLESGYNIHKYVIESMDDPDLEFTLAGDFLTSLEHTLDFSNEHPLPMHSWKVRMKYADYKND